MEEQRSFKVSGVLDTLWGKELKGEGVRSWAPGLSKRQRQQRASSHPQIVWEREGIASVRWVCGRCVHMQGALQGQEPGAHTKVCIREDTNH